MKVDLSEYTLLENKEQFLEMWPLPKYGEYRPQPSEQPYEYPCLVREVCIQEACNGRDYAILSLLYFIEEKTNEE